MLRAADVSFTYGRGTGRAATGATETAHASAPAPVPRGHDALLALKDVVLDVDRGDLVGILGPNGSGKTTLLKLLGGVLRPRSGSVTLDGRPLAEWSRREIARRIAFVPQETTAPFDFTVLDIVLMGRF